MPCSILVFFVLNNYLFCLCRAFVDESSLQALIDKTKLNPSEVGDIVVGTVLAPGSHRAIECRMATFYAGFPGTSLTVRYLISLACLIVSPKFFIHKQRLFH